MRSANRTKWVLPVAFLAATLPAMAMAEYIDLVDQVQDTWNSTATVSSSSAEIGQSFTSGYPRALKAVQLDVGIGAGDLSLDLYEASGGLPTETYLGTSATVYSATKSSTSPVPDSDWTRFSFSEPVPLTEGSQYAFVLKTTSDNLSSFHYQSSGDAYTAGTYFWRLTGYQDDWTAIAGRDITFRTIMTPEPGTLVGLLSMGLVGMVGYGWRKRRPG